MTMRQITSQTLNLLKNRLLWGFALLAVSADFLIVLHYDRHETDFAVTVFFLVLFALLVEGALIRTTYQQVAGRNDTFADGMMMSLMHMPQLVALKLMSLIVAAPSLILAAVAARNLYNGHNVPLAVILLVTILSLTVFVQLMTHLTTVALLGEETTFGMAISKAWHVVTQQRMLVLGYLALFLIIDLAMIGWLMQAGFITQATALEFERLAYPIYSNPMVGASRRVVGEQFTAARLFNSAFAILFGVRGVDVVNGSLQLMQSTLGGLHVAAYSFILLPFRSAFLTKLYVEVEGVPLPMHKALRKLPVRPKPVIVNAAISASNGG